MVDLAKKSTVKRNFWIVAVVLLILAAASYGGWRLYRIWEPRRLAKRARALVQKGDLIDAQLTVRHAFSINPDDVATIRLVAEITENSKDSGALNWRYRLVDLQPGSLDAVIDCAETALRFERPAMAQSVLAKMADTGKENGRYHEILGRTASASHEPNRAVEEFAKALKLEPQNESYQLGYAAALLDRGWLEDRATARSTLDRLGATPKFRVRALRTLVRDSTANHELTTATSLARELVATTDADFADKVTLLDLLRHTSSPDFSSAFASLEASARGKAPQLAAVLLWMNRNDRSREALEWAYTFSPEEWSDPRVCEAAALCSYTLRAWPQLQALTQGGWQKLECMRCALLARALREQGDFAGASQQWKAAVTAAARQPGAESELARLTENWGWTAEFEKLLRSALDQPTGNDWALPKLLSLLARKKDTVALWDVTAHFMKANPASDAAANNFALYSLLLGRDITRASQIAQTVYDKHPHEAPYVSTYAYALHARGHSVQALRVMSVLTPEELDTPSVAAYYGILLAATGDRDRASRFLNLARNADLLPEEERLIQLAHRQAE